MTNLKEMIKTKNKSITTAQDKAEFIAAEPKHQDVKIILPKRTERVQLVMTPIMKETLQSYCKDNNISINKFIERLINEKLGTKL